MLNERRADELKRMTKDQLIAHIAELEGTMNGILNDWHNKSYNEGEFCCLMIEIHVGKMKKNLGENGQN